MTVDDLSAPLGQRPARRRREFPVSVPKVIAAALALFLGVFVVWAIVSDDPFGGEPRVAVPIDQRGLAAANKPEGAASQNATTTSESQLASPQSRPAAPPATKTVTIIDGKTGARQEVVIPASENEAPSASANGKGAR